ncbi:MAG: outer membrane beta-barrel protein [Thermoanaerobaculia bacterium]
MALALAWGMAPAPARAETWFGVAGGAFDPAEDETVDNAQVFGVRAGHLLSPSFALEAALSRSDLSDTLPENDEPDFPTLDFKFELQILHLDLSAQWYPWTRERGFLVFGGGGMSRLEARFTSSLFGESFSDTSTRNIFTAHAGVAYEWDLGKSLFVRPEARYRYLFSDDKVDQGDNLTVIYDASGPEASLVLGWRLGPGKQ